MEVDSGDEKGKGVRSRSESQSSQNSKRRSIERSEMDDNRKSSGNSYTLKDSAEKLFHQLKKENKIFDEDFDERAFMELSSLPEKEQKEVLLGFTSSGKKVRHPRAFISSMIRRIRRRLRENLSRDDLPESVREELNKLIQNGRYKIDGNEFDNKYLSTFVGIGKERMQHDVIKDFLETDMENVKNGTAFFGGIVKRYFKEAHDGVSKDILDLLEEGYETNKHLNRNDLDEQCIKALGKFREPLALRMVDSFISSDLSDVRNMTGFFFGVISRIDKEDRRRGRSRSRDRGKGNGRGSRGYARDRDRRHERGRSIGRDHGYGRDRPRSRDLAHGHGARGRRRYRSESRERYDGGRDRDRRDYRSRSRDYISRSRDRGYGGRDRDRDRY